ncbi:retrotransposon protein [Cucumis melo var. makuwa]|uniref:Retrotransposon protein n=1 Tax=Cucumis melo var. makuwa TaxID=1194695 RepID=A0A5A7SS17_CUCMM|nr:retrotransposon protein [Cucumis melo var. makuwa]TYK19045.1 retrotransposon protein [Cucumis melo var. makuwa]
MSASTHAPRHVWTKEEEGTLVESLMELVLMGGWKSNNGTFRLGYLAQLVQMMAEKLSGCRVHATTVIDCRIKTLKWTFQAIDEMQGPARSGFWHPATKGLLNKSFSYYDELTYVFGRDRATGRFPETFADVGSNDPDGYEGFDMMDGNEEFRLCTARGLTCRRTMYTHHDIFALQRVGLDRVDPRRRGKVSERWMLKAYIWHSTKQTSNSG